MDSTSPASLFGGMWTRIKDAFLLAAGDTYAAGSTGGESTHTLTVNEMPNHGHNFHYSSTDKGIETSTRALNDFGSAYSDQIAVDTQVGCNWSSQGYLIIDETGGGQPHNNMPPYLTVYMWQRVG